MPTFELRIEPAISPLWSLLFRSPLTAPCAFVFRKDHTERERERERERVHASHHRRRHPRPLLKLSACVFTRPRRIWTLAFVGYPGSGQRRERQISYPLSVIHIGLVDTSRATGIATSYGGLVCSASFPPLMASVWRRVVSLLPFHYLHAIFQKQRMDELELGGHTIKSHGAALAKNHMHDWLILLLLAVLEVILNIIHPFYRFVGKEMMMDLKYPMKGNTVPVWAVPVYAVLLPISVFFLVYMRRRDVYDLHHGILGLLYSVLITGVITDAIKNATGRPRPDFFWRCFPDGIEAYDKLGNVICHGQKLIIREGYKSFPSGHASWSFAGLGFLSLYLCGKIKVFDRKGHIAKLCIILLPLLLASLVAVSRVDDYWHHWQDVFAASFIGLIVAVFCYHQFFPPPYSDDGWGPYAYFRALEEMHPNSNSAHPSNGISAQAMEAQAMNRQTRPYRNPVLSPVAQEERSPFDDVEFGRR